MGTLSSLSRQRVELDEFDVRELAERLPSGFVFGTATSSYQIEGAFDVDGRGESVWDRFSHTEGNTFGGGTGDVACDHYNRFRDDVRLMASMGISAYRFSIAWPRIIPDGSGAVNSKGLDFYDLLVDELLAHGITPYPTLFHWDLPQALEDRGGWYERDTADGFEKYVRAVVGRLGDRVGTWITLNEPWVQAWLGYGAMIHAPGRGDGDRGGVIAGHNLLRAHGKAVRVIRELSPGARVGITLDFSTIYPASASEPDQRAAVVADARKNRWFLDPVIRGTYPEEAGDLTEMLPEGWRDDMTEVAAPIEFLGVNYYTRTVIRAGDDGRPQSVRVESVPRMDSDWEIFPQGLSALLVRLGSEYEIDSIFVTENGAAFSDKPDDSGRVRDTRRIQYLAQHIGAVADAVEKGARVDGYFVWSFLDNFEWGSAYDDNTRFGVVYIDYATQERIPKDSARWYSELIAAHRESM